jgi:hypothetical protein
MGKWMSINLMLYKKIRIWNKLQIIQIERNKILLFLIKYYFLILFFLFYQKNKQLNYYFHSKFKLLFLKSKMGIGDWGLGIGDWGLGIGPNGQSPIPNPQSPIPNPQWKIDL